MSQSMNQSQYLIVVLGKLQKNIFEYSQIAEYLLTTVSQKYQNYIFSELVNEFRYRKRKLMNTLMDAVFFLEQGTERSQELNEEIKKIIDSLLKSEFEAANKMLEDFKDKEVNHE